MRLLLFLTVSMLVSSCWPKPKPAPNPGYSNYNKRVWGNKPVYDAAADAKRIVYIDSALPVIIPGNIYAKGDLIYQLEIGRGIHVIDNHMPSNAQRIGFITVNGSSQISIKDDFLYTNSYDDLVVIDISDINSVTEVSRVLAAFPNGRYDYYYNQPIESGYYECPRHDSVVIGWEKDSILPRCYKN